MIWLRRVAALALALIPISDVFCKGSDPFGLSELHSNCTIAFSFGDDVAHLTLQSQEGKISPLLAEVITPKIAEENLKEKLTLHVTREGKKPENGYELAYDPKSDPYMLQVRTNLSRTTFVIHEDVDVASLKGGHFVPLKVVSAGANKGNHGRRLAVAQKRSTTRGKENAVEDDGEWVIGIHPLWLMTDEQLVVLLTRVDQDMSRDSAEKESLKTAIHTVREQSYKKRLWLLQGLVRGAVRGDNNLHPTLPLPGATEFVPTYEQRDVMKQVQHQLEVSLSDDFDINLGIRPIRFTDQNPASTGKTVETALNIRMNVLRTEVNSKYKEYDLDPDKSLGWDAEDTIVVYNSPSNMIQDGAIRDFSKALGIEEKEIVRAYGNSAGKNFDELNARTKFLAISGALFGADDFDKGKEILAHAKRHGKRVVMVLDEVHHAGNINQLYAGAFRWLNGIYQQGLMPTPTSKADANVLIIGISATTWGNALAETKDRPAQNIITDVDFFGVRSTRLPGCGRCGRGKIVAGFLHAGEIDSPYLEILRTSNDPAQLAEVARIQSLNAASGGYTSPIRHIDVVSDQELGHATRDSIDEVIAKKLKLINAAHKKKVKQIEANESLEVEERVVKLEEERVWRDRELSRARIGHLFRKESITEGLTRLSTVYIDEFILERVYKFLLDRKEKNNPDRAIIFVESIDHANQLQLALQVILNEPERVQAYGKSKVLAMHSGQTDGTRRKFRDWLDGSEVFEDDDFDTHRIGIVVDSLDEGANVRALNRVIFLDQSTLRSLDAVRRLIQRLNRAGRVAVGKTGTDVLDFVGVTSILLQEIHEVHVNPGRSVVREPADKVEAFTDSEVTDIVSDLGDFVTSELAFVQEQATYQFPVGEAHLDFFKWAARMTPFMIRNQDGYSGFAVDTINFLFKFTTMDSSGYLDESNQVFNKAVAHFVNSQRLKSRMAEDLARRLMNCIAYVNGLRRHYSNWQAAEELLKEEPANVSLNVERSSYESDAKQSWIAIAKELKNMDPYLNASLNMIASPVIGSKHPMVGANLSSALLDFYESLFQKMETSKLAINGIDLGDWGITNFKVLESSVPNSSEIIVQGQGAYAYLNGQQGYNKMIFRSARGNQTRAEVHTMNILLETSLAVSSQLLSSITNNITDRDRRRWNGQNGSTVLNGSSPFPELDTDLQIANHGYSADNMFEYPRGNSDEIILHFSMEMLTGWEAYMRKVLKLRLQSPSVP